MDGDGTTTTSRYCSQAGTRMGRCVAILGGGLGRGRRQLDSLVYVSVARRMGLMGWWIVSEWDQGRAAAYMSEQSRSNLEKY